MGRWHDLPVIISAGTELPAWVMAQAEDHPSSWAGGLNLSSLAKEGLHGSYSWRFPDTLRLCPRHTLAQDLCQSSWGEMPQSGVVPSGPSASLGSNFLVGVFL